MRDRKDTYKEKKHERYGSPVRHQDFSSHRGFLKFKHKKGQGASSGGARRWVLEEPRHGSGHGITYRSSRDPRREFWENDKNAYIPSFSNRPIDDVLCTPSHARSLNNTREKHYSREQRHSDYSKYYERDISLEWKPLNRWNSSGRFYSRGTEKGRNKNVNTRETDANETEETRKRSRLSWGDGLARFEKKKGNENGNGENAAVATPTSVACISLPDKFEKKKAEHDGVSAAVVAATPTPIACTFLPGVVGTLGVKVDNGAPNLGASSDPHHSFSLSWQRVEDSSLKALTFKISELRQGSSSSVITQLDIWKKVITKVLELTETDIAALTNELKSLQSESPHDAIADAIAASDEDNAENNDNDNGNDDDNDDDLDYDNVYKTIISSNRETAESSCAVFDKFLPGNISNVGVSSRSADTFIKEKFAEKKRFAEFKEKVLTVKYKAFDHLWKKDMCLRSASKSKRPPISLSKGRIKNRSSIHFRFPFPGGNRLSLVSTSDMITYTSQLISESKDDDNRKILKMPPLILDQEDKKFSKLNSRNGLVEDPLAVEKERALINPWTSEERQIFSEKFASFGKDFRKISSFLDHKTTADCVEFYYRTYKPNNLDKDKKKKDNNSNQKVKSAKTSTKTSGKKGKGKGKMNVDADKNWGEAPGTPGTPRAGNIRTPSGRLLLWRRSDDQGKTSTDDGNNDIREKVGKDSLVGINDSQVDPPCQQPMTANVAPDTDVGTCHRTDKEKAESSFGNDSAMIVRLGGTKSKNQVKRIIIKGLKSLSRPLNHVNGGNDKDDARVCADKDKSSTKTNEEQPSSAMNSNHEKSKPVEATNLSAEFNEPMGISQKVDHKDENVVSKVGDAVTELVSASRITEPCNSHAVVAEDALVSLLLRSMPSRLNCRDGEQEADDNMDDAAELENQNHVPNTAENASLIVSSSTLAFGAENLPQQQLLLKKSNDDSLIAANTMLQNISGAADVQREETDTGDGPSVKEGTDTRCSSRVNESTVLSQNIEEETAADSDKTLTQMSCLPDSERTPANAVVLKLFGKMITVPSSPPEA